MGDDYRYCDPCRDGDRHHDHDKYKDSYGKYDHCDPCDHKDDDWSEWLPILIIIFILIGGLDWFGGDKDSCGKDGSGSWLLILLVIFLIWQGSDGKKGSFGLF